MGVSPLASLAGPVDATGVTLQEEEEEEKKKMFDLKLESLLQRPCHQDQDHQGGEDLYRPEVEGAREEEELLLWDPLQEGILASFIQRRMAEVSETMAASSGGEDVVAAPHRLERKWTFWFDNQSKPKQGAAWGTALRKVYTFDTVEEFWWYDTPDGRSVPPDLYYDLWCFRGFIVRLASSSRYLELQVFHIIVSKVCITDGYGPYRVIAILSNFCYAFNWILQLMALIGEQFEESEEICGIVVSVRQRQDKLALWTKAASNEAVQVLFF
ncbi:hypothetical protein GW17_00025797 [Ensete ventricosum]|nr:hypothetical protein GW17_00025797 [Ensete ventricosum]